VNLTRDQILQAADVGPLVAVDLPEWGGTAHVRVMTGTQRDRFEAAFALDKANVRARLAAYTLCDEAGQPLFAEADVAALGERSSLALDRVFAAAMKLNGIGKPDVDALEKNSETVPSASTASGSPPASA
jgi:hypothetical protein